MSLTRQEVFQALADGKEVELTTRVHSNPWHTLEDYFNCLSADQFQFYNWRIKPEPPEWYENIPEHGVLCWYGSKYHELPVKSRCLTIITRYLQGEGLPFVSSSGARHENCLPLTNEEIKQFFIRESE